MALKLAVWDMDGTLVDSREVIQTAMVRAFEGQGLAPPPYDATRRVVGLGLGEAIGALVPPDFPPDRLPGLVEAYRQDFVLRRAEPGFREPLYDGALGLLARLRAEGWLMAVATGKSHRGVRAVFDMHPLEPFFDTVWCADDGPGKPHPFMIEEAMRATGAAPPETLMIGDAVHDIGMGRAAGVQTHGVSWGFGRADELADAGADFVHDDFAALEAAVLAFRRG